MRRRRGEGTGGEGRRGEGEAEGDPEAANNEKFPFSKQIRILPKK